MTSGKHKRPAHLVDLDNMKGCIRVLVVIGNRPGHDQGLLLEYTSLGDSFYHILSARLSIGQRAHIVRELKVYRKMASNVKQLFDMLSLFINELRKV